jgi:hypothetical protein
MPTPTPESLRASAQRIKSYIDFSTLRLGDRMAAAWYAQHRCRQTGERFGVIDRHIHLPEPFPMTTYFPDTFVDVTEADVIHGEMEEWNQGILWLTAANEFNRTGISGTFERIPAEVLSLAAERTHSKRQKRPRVVMHVLDDAKYNDRRNWHRKDAEALTVKLREAGCEVVILNPERERYTGNFASMLAEMLAADAFIGGDTGPSHVFAMLCPDKPQLAIYPDMTEDRKTYAQVQNALNLPQPWNSLPFRKDLAVLQLSPSRRLMRNGFKIRRAHVGRFDPTEAADIMLGLL